MSSKQKGPEEFHPAFLLLISQNQGNNKCTHKEDLGITELQKETQSSHKHSSQPCYLNLLYNLSITIQDVMFYGNKLSSCVKNHRSSPWCHWFAARTMADLFGSLSRLQ